METDIEKPISLFNLLKKDIPEPETYVKPFAPAGGVSFFFGEPGSGKSLAVIRMGIEIAYAETYLNMISY